MACLYIFEMNFIDFFLITKHLIKVVDKLWIGNIETCFNRKPFIITFVKKFKKHIYKFSQILYLQTFLRKIL